MNKIQHSYKNKQTKLKTYLGEDWHGWTIIIYQFGKGELAWMDYYQFEKGME